MRIDTGTDLLLAEVDGPLGLVERQTAERHNVLSMAMQEAIPGVVEAWQADPAIRVIVIEGAELGDVGTRDERPPAAPRRRTAPTTTSAPARRGGCGATSPSRPSR